MNVSGGHGRGIGSGGGGSDSGNFLRSSLNQILHPDADVISLDVESLDQIDLAQIVIPGLGLGRNRVTKTGFVVVLISFFFNWALTIKTFFVALVPVNKGGICGNCNSRDPGDGNGRQGGVDDVDGVEDLDSNDDGVEGGDGGGSRSNWLSINSTFPLRSTIAATLHVLSPLSFCEIFSILFPSIIPPCFRVTNCFLIATASFD